MRNILVISDSKARRMVLRRYILSELDDILITEASPDQEGFQIVLENKYDLIICCNLMKGMNGPSVKQWIKQHSSYGETPFLLITSDNYKDEHADLIKQGIDDILIIPCPSRMMRLKIDALCNPISFRVHERVYIPGTAAILYLQHYRIETKVINFSHGGVLCEFVYLDYYSDLLKKNEIELHFPPEFGNLRTEKIYSSLLRLKVLSQKADFSPETIQTAFRIIEISEGDSRVLNHVIQKAQRDLDAMLHV